MQIERAAESSADDRTVKLAFSSDAPIYHWFGYLILDHSPGSARLERINQTGALLWMHDRKTQIGSVSDVRLEKDGKGRCTAKFSRVGLGAEKYQDVQDGICRTVSFGFSIYALDAEVGQDGKQMEIDGEPVYRSRDWEPFEVSFEPIPADISVGLDRSKEENQQILEKNASRSERGNPLITENKMSKENEIKEPQTAAVGTEVREQIPAAPAAAQNVAITRAAEFNAFGEQFGEIELARDHALDETKTLADLGKAIVAKRAAAQVVVPPASPESIASRQGQQIIELARSNYRGQLKSFHGADAQVNAYRSGQFLLASLFRDETAQKFCRENGISFTRTQTGSSNELGGYFVPVEMESAIIDLRIEYGVVRRRFNVTPMTSDTKNQNRRTGGLKAVPVGPGKRGEKSKATWDQIELVARKWMVLAKYEDEVSEDASISMADTLTSEIAYAFSQSEDEAGFLGDGTSAYHGIVGVLPKLKGLSGTIANIAGLQVASGNAWSEITEADLLGVVGRLPQFARRSGQVAWFCSHTFWANVLQRIALAKGGVSYAEINGQLKEVFMGVPVEIVEVMPTTEGNSQIPLLYGNATQAATFGDRRGVTVKMTDSNDVDFESDIQTIKGTERFDINVHDVGNADASAGNRKAGPVVGLITAAS